MIINKILTLALLITVLAHPAFAEEDKNYISEGKGQAKQKDAKKYNLSLSRDLVYRVAFSQADAVKTLLDKGANPQAKNIAGVSVLLIAVVRKDDEAPGIVQNLIKAGANVNAVGKNGEVAVLEAVKNGRPDVLQILIDNHAVLGLVHDAEGFDLLSVAEARGNLDIVKILNAGIENEKDKIQALKSQDNFINLIQQYAYLSCANEYLNFYIADRPKNVNMLAFNDVITGNANEITNVGGEIKTLFKMTDSELLEIQQASRGQIITQLNYYETAPNRELNGVGTDEDLNGRCWKIARKWNARNLNLEQYRQNTK